MIDDKYLNINNINNYIKKGTQIYKTEYSNGTVTTGYDILIKDIIINSDSDMTITIVVSENDKYTIEIDYTNLISILNSNIGNCKVTLKYETIKYFYIYYSNLGDNFYLLLEKILIMCYHYYVSSLRKEGCHMWRWFFWWM